MRVSVKKGDDGFVKNPCDYNVYIDGVLNKHCITADEESGFALVYVVNSNDIIQVSNGLILDKIVYGDIKIVTIMS